MIRTAPMPPDMNASYADTTPAIDNARLQYILSIIRTCFLPIIVLGTFTNCLNFVLLSHRAMRGSSTTVFLFSLAVADLGVMYFELFRIWFEWTEIIDPARYFTDTYCKIANYANGVFRDYSNWLIACLTLERLIKVAWPYRAQRICTRSLAKRVSLALFLCICVPHIFCLVYTTAQFNIWYVCWFDHTSPPQFRIAAAGGELVTGYLVVIIVFLLNLRLMALLYRKDRLPLVSSSSSSKGSATAVSVPSSLVSYRLRAQSKRLTRTLLLVAVVFLVCETPRVLLFSLLKVVQTPLMRILTNAAFALSGVNHAANFFIYIVSSPRFRELLVDMLRRRGRGAGGGRGEGWARGWGAGSRRADHRCAAAVAHTSSCGRGAGGAGGSQCSEASVRINLQVFLPDSE